MDRAQVNGRAWDRIPQRAAFSPSNCPSLFTRWSLGFSDKISRLTSSEQGCWVFIWNLAPLTIAKLLLPLGHTETALYGLSGSLPFYPCELEPLLKNCPCLHFLPPSYPACLSHPAGTCCLLIIKFFEHLAQQAQLSRTLYALPSTAC